MSQPLTGVFSTCSPNRPNPIGLHRARIAARDGLRIEVDALEAIDGTPVVDVSRPSTRPHDALRAAHLALGRAMRLRPGPPPIAERRRRSGGSRAKSRRSERPTPDLTAWFRALRNRAICAGIRRRYELGLRAHIGSCLGDSSGRTRMRMRRPGQGGRDTRRLRGRGADDLGADTTPIPARRSARLQRTLPGPGSRRCPR